MKIRFAGFGGQGIVLCGVVFGQAAMLDGKRSIQTQSYGSASRGGLTRSDVCIQEDEIYDLLYDEIDVLVAMSQQSHDAFEGGLVSDGHLFYEKDMVTPAVVAAGASGHSLGISATDLAFKQLGRKVVANMIMMGFVNGALGLVSHDSLVATVTSKVPPGTEKLNIEALELGHDHARAARAT
jgi:2-oxoglutarate ferredoxin oxidoreductase subunit gamma